MCSLQQEVQEPSHGRPKNSRQNGQGTAPFGHPVVRWRRARGGPWLSGLRPDAVSQMRLRALVVAALPALAGVVRFPPRILSVSRGEVLPAGVDRRSSGLGSASSAGA